MGGKFRNNNCTIKKMENNKLISLLLRAGIAFSFFYAAIFSFVNPTNWIGFFPSFLTNLIPGVILLPIFSVYEILLGLWLISNKKIFYASVLSSMTLFSVVIFNLGVLDIVFRDISILFASIALSFLSREEYL